MSSATKKITPDMISEIPPEMIAGEDAAQAKSQSRGVQLPPENVYANSDEFQSLLVRAKEQGMDTLSQEEQKRVQVAAENFPQVAEYLKQPRENPAVDSLKQFASTVEKEWAGHSSDPILKEQVKTVRDFLRSVDDFLTDPKVREAPAKLLGAPQPLSEMLQEGFADIGLSPLPSDATKMVYDEKGKLKEVKRSTASILAENTVRGAVRLLPELMVSLIENPYEFTKEIVALPLHELALINDAFYGAPLAGASLGKMTTAPTEKDVQQAREELIQNPMGVIMLGMMGLGAGKALSRMKPRYTTVKTEALETAAKEAESAQRTIKTLEKEKQDAVQKPGTEKVDVQEQAKDGKALGEGNVKGEKAAEASKAPPPEEVSKVVVPRREVHINEADRVGSNLAHDKQSVANLEKFLAEKTDLEPKIRQAWEETLTKKKADLAESQKAYDEFVKPLEKEEKGRTETEQVLDPPSIVVQRAKDIGPTSFVRTPSNLFGAIPGEKANYGQAAAEASRQLLLTERDIIIETGRRTDKLGDVLEGVSKKKYGKKLEKLYDHVVDPTRDAQLDPVSRKAVETIREQFESDRQEVIQLRREDLRPTVTVDVTKRYRAENDLKGKKLSKRQKTEIDEKVDAELAERVPDDWGVENYAPEMHPGSWEVWATRMGEEGVERQWVGAARTPFEAKKKALEWHKNNPEYAPDDFVVTGRAFRGTGDVVRVSRGRLNAMLSEMAKAAEGSLSRDQVADFVRGKIGAKESKTKFAGFLQKREGFTGFSKDVPAVLGVYNQNFVRWKHLKGINRQIEPLLSELRAEGRPNAARFIEALRDHLWGRTNSQASMLLDAGIQKVPGLKDVVQPMLLERSAGKIKSVIVHTYLLWNPRFHALNRMQRFQTLAPVVTAGEWRAGTKFYRSKEGRAALDQFGIKYLTGGKTLEGRKGTWIKPEFREKARGFAPETSNQEIAWATMYKRAKEMGFDDVAANDYAFLKGNVHSQFVHLVTDQPRLTQGPIMSTIFQFKRFPIKNVEMGVQLLAKRDFRGSAKWLGAQLLLGGAKMAAKTATAGGAAWVTYEAYQKIKKEYGETVADAIAWGLPSLIGLDMSYSFQLIDTPYGATVPEKIGNTFLGPSGNLLVQVGESAVNTKGPEPSAVKRTIKEVSENVPALRWIQSLDALMEKADKGEYEFRDPSGRVKFKGDIQDVIVKALGGRTIEEAQMQMISEALTEVNAQRDRALDQIANTFVEALKEGRTVEGDDLDDMLDWNEMWPEFPITGSAVTDRIKARYEGLEKDRVERFLDNLPKVFRQIEADYMEGK